jgi:hypothetical protein
MGYHISVYVVNYTQSTFTRNTYKATDGDIENTEGGASPELSIPPSSNNNGMCAFTGYGRSIAW